MINTPRLARKNMSQISHPAPISSIASDRVTIENLITTLSNRFLMLGKSTNSKINLPVKLVRESAIKPQQGLGGLGGSFLCAVRAILSVWSGQIFASAQNLVSWVSIN